MLLARARLRLRRPRPSPVLAHLQTRHGRGEVTLLVRRIVRHCTIRRRVATLPAWCRWRRAVRLAVGTLCAHRLQVKRRSDLTLALVETSHAKRLLEVRKQLLDTLVGLGGLVTRSFRRLVSEEGDLARIIAFE